MNCRFQTDQSIKDVQRLKSWKVEEKSRKAAACAHSFKRLTWLDFGIIQRLTNESVLVISAEVKSSVATERGLHFQEENLQSINNESSKASHRCHLIGLATPQHSTQLKPIKLTRLIIVIESSMISKCSWPSAQQSSFFTFSNFIGVSDKSREMQAVRRPLYTADVT